MPHNQCSLGQNAVESEPLAFLKGNYVATSGDYEWKVVERLVPLVDLWFFDCKETEPDLHRKFSGVDNSRLRANLQMLHNGGARILLR